MSEGINISIKSACMEGRLWSSFEDAQQYVNQVQFHDNVSSGFQIFHKAQVTITLGTMLFLEVSGQSFNGTFNPEPLHNQSTGKGLIIFAFSP